jgi:methionyl aminopeptidase
MITIKSPQEIEKMREVGKMAAACLSSLMKQVKAGVTAVEIEKLCHDWIVERGAIPATLNYGGGHGQPPFPSSLCISVNDVVCHGIPDKRAFRSGDIVNLDVTPKLKGWHGDTNATVLVGNVDPKTRELVEVTYQCMWDGIAQVKPGASLGDIGYAIQTRAQSHGYSVVIEYCGHGIGREFHEDPQVSHVGRKGMGPKLKPGMTFTIEPMINRGQRFTYVEDDGWTVRTRDRSMSAQFEHTVLVTETGVEVLTLREDEVPPIDVATIR